MERWVLISIIIAAYLLLTLTVGLLAGRRSSDSVAGVVAADRSFVSVNTAKVSDEEVKYTTDAEGFRERLLANEPSPPTYNTAVTNDILAEDEEIVSFDLAINPDRVRVVPVEEMFREVQ